MEAFKYWIEKNFKELGADKGFAQNRLDIMRWRDEGRVSDGEYHELRSYNRKAYHNLPLDA